MGVSCRVLYSIVNYLYVNCSGSITSVGKERAYLSAIVYLDNIDHCRNHVVSVRRGVLFLLLPRVGCLILLWHSLCLPYDYFGD